MITVIVALACTANASAQGYLPSQLTVEIRTMDACLDVPGGSSADHLRPQMFPCHGGSNQRWFLRYDFGGFATIVSQQTEKCLEAGGTNGIQQFSCNGSDRQRWRLVHDSNQVRFRIQPKNEAINTRCLRVNDDRQVSILDCDNTPFAEQLSSERFLRQNFEIVVYPESGFNVLVNERRGWCLDVASLSHDNNAPIQHYPCNGGANQLWHLARQADGSVTIQAQHSGKCLKWGGLTINRRETSQATCASSQAEQNWRLKLTSAGRVNIQTKEPGPDFCLNSPSGSETTNKLRIDSCSISADRWRLGEGRFVSGALNFFTGNNGMGNVVCGLSPRTAEYNFTRHRACENDDARSLTLLEIAKDTVVEVYDDSRCRTRDDWARITVKSNIARYTVNTFERSTENELVKVEYMTRGNLDGKVSCVKVRSP